MTKAKDIIGEWPEEAREAAQLVIDAHGEPHEATGSQLVWYGVGAWKRVVATKAFYRHEFPAPHFDSVESVIDYRVPPEMATPLATYDGSVVVERTAGEISARCHDEQANFLALNLAHDIVTGRRTVEEARAYYAKEFLDYRRRKPTPYMEKLHFTRPATAPATRTSACSPTTTSSARSRRERPRERGGLTIACRPRVSRRTIRVTSW